MAKYDQNPNLDPPHWFCSLNPELYWDKKLDIDTSADSNQWIKIAFLSRRVSTLGTLAGLPGPQVPVAHQGQAWGSGPLQQKAQPSAIHVSTAACQRLFVPTSVVELEPQ